MVDNVQKMMNTITPFMQERIGPFETGAPSQVKKYNIMSPGWLKAYL